MNGFEVVYRNYGHWDIYLSGYRIYRIRGAPGNYEVWSEEGNSIKVFKSVLAAMNYVCDELMYELVAKENQEVTRIEDWN